MHTVCTHTNPHLHSTAIQGCGGASHELKGVIKSQNWPMNYKAASECMWSVEVPKGKTITLTFTHFDVEAKDIFTSKCLDNVVAYDIYNDGAESTKHSEYKYGDFKHLIE